MSNLLALTVISNDFERLVLNLASLCGMALAQDLAQSVAFIRYLMLTRARSRR